MPKPSKFLLTLIATLLFAGTLAALIAEPVDRVTALLVLLGRVFAAASTAFLLYLVLQTTED